MVVVEAGVVVTGGVAVVVPVVEFFFVVETSGSFLPHIKNLIISADDALAKDWRFEEEKNSSKSANKSDSCGTDWI